MIFTSTFLIRSLIPWWLDFPMCVPLSFSWISIRLLTKLSFWWTNSELSCFSSSSWFSLCLAELSTVSKSFTSILSSDPKCSVLWVGLSLTTTCAFNIKSSSTAASWLQGWSDLRKHSMPSVIWVTSFSLVSGDNSFA